VAYDLASPRKTFGRYFADLPTGIKMLSIISFALIPLGLIALLASLQANRTADLQRRADLRVAVTEGTLKLGTELSADISVLLAAANSIGREGEPTFACARLGAIMRARPQSPTGLAIFGSDRRLKCASGGFRPLAGPQRLFDAVPEAVFDDDGIELRVPGEGGATMAIARYSAATIAGFVRPIGISVPYSLTLVGDLRELPLATRDVSFLVSTETFSAPVGVLDLSLRMSVERAPFSAIELLLTFLPLLMWASAAAVGFLVVDRLLIRPLAQLRAAVAGLQPGEEFAVPEIKTPALEIRELAETFGRVGRTLTEHEQSLEKALTDQTRLTREVHHRVKNNLQVIASLISLHARGAPAGEVAEAYASIQRRVDALAIVHRNHYAELEVHGGISAKAFIGEIAANLRAGAIANGPVPAISTSAPAVRVSQDVAVPIAFMLTELTELSISIDRAAALTIGVTATADVLRATLSIQSTALCASAELDEQLARRYSRIIEGLARQLRAPLSYDGDTGRYAIDVAILPESTI